MTEKLTEEQYHAKFIEYFEEILDILKEKKADKENIKQNKSTKMTLINGEALR